MSHPREFCEGGLNCNRAALLTYDLRNGRGPMAQIGLYRGGMRRYPVPSSTLAARAMRTNRA
eukprot:15250598-Alexandrium_andersonii.AAC.1